MTEEQSAQSYPILIAEDSLDDASLLQIVFKRGRIINPLRIVHDGEQAIEYLRGEGPFADRTAHPYPVLFLLDLKMPRKGGMDVLRWLADNPPPSPMPVVVTAGAGEMREVNCAYSLGARSFLVKPLNWLDVMELLSCFRELRMAAQGENYALEPVELSRSRPLAQKPTLCGYKPQPLDTSRLKLTDDILRLTELLAENNHEIWARDRMQQGWSYGPKRDDDRKEHPCLVPYGDLPESEKSVDRNVALENIKTIFSFGLPYPVMEKATDRVRAEVMDKTLATLEGHDLGAEQLRTIWEEHNSVVWAQCVELYRRAMEVSLRCGEAFLALDIAAEGLKKYGSDLHLRQMQALALARTGAIDNANDILEQLRSAKVRDEETLTVLARTYKDLSTVDEGRKRRHLKLSFELYCEAYKLTGTYAAGINAAVTGLLYGEREAAFQIAQEVEKLCRIGLQRTDIPAAERYSLESAMAESLLVRGDISAAEKSYCAACDIAGQNCLLISRARTQARQLLERNGHPPHQLDACFNLPPIVVCSGHPFDKPEWQQMRFPFGLESRVREEMRRTLEQLGSRIGFSSLASGADLLFAEAILELGGRIHIVLPCNRQEFKRLTVDIIPGAKLGERFDQVLAKATSVTVLDEECGGTDLAVYEYCNRILMGHALLKSRVLGLDVVPLAVWDGRSRDCVEGTHNFIQLWTKRGTPVEIIRVDKILDTLASQDIFLRQRQILQKAAAVPELPPRETEVATQTIQAVLFAEVRGNSRLSPGQVPKFVKHFLMEVSTMLDSLAKPPIARNTWGDTIHCVFDEVSEAGNFALALQELTQRRDWVDMGLPGNLNVRITLHAGPVYSCVDPVSGKASFLGPHVNHATRIEPIADEGQIYATEAFATVAESHGIKEYACEFVGQKTLPGRYETIPVFMVRRRAIR